MYTDRLTDELCWILSLTVDSTTSVNVYLIVTIFSHFG